MIKEIHGLDFVFDKLIKFALMDCTQSIEAGTADDLFFEPLEKAGPFFTSDEDVELVNCAN
jgi:hypothetical protein